MSSERARLSESLWPQQWRVQQRDKCRKRVVLRVPPARCIHGVQTQRQCVYSFKHAVHSA
eukprot:2079857-Pyramimonas_sp.AAC.1